LSFSWWKSLTDELLDRRTTCAAELPSLLDELNETLAA